MTKRRLGSVVAALSLLAAAPAIAEQRVQWKDLPPAVQQAVQANLNGGTLKGLSAVSYEALVERNGKQSEVALDANGKSPKR
jgi:hypothetical protein